MACVGKEEPPPCLRAHFHRRLLAPQALLGAGEGPQVYPSILISYCSQDT